MILTVVQILLTAIDSTFTFPDTDGDGIDDRMDACIDEAENFNGYLDWDGCPEVAGTTAGDMLDADYDGIADHLDECPMLAERYNKFQDDDGCPDSIDIKQLEILTVMVFLMI